MDFLTRCELPNWAVILWAVVGLAHAKLAEVLVAMAQKPAPEPREKGR